MDDLLFDSGSSDFSNTAPHCLLDMGLEGGLFRLMKWIIFHLSDLGQERCPTYWNTSSSSCKKNVDLVLLSLGGSNLTLGVLSCPGLWLPLELGLVSSKYKLQMPLATILCIPPNLAINSIQMLWVLQLAQQWGRCWEVNRGEQGR